MSDIDDDFYDDDDVEEEIEYDDDLADEADYEDYLDNDVGEGEEDMDDEADDL